MIRCHPRSHNANFVPAAQLVTLMHPRVSNKLQVAVSLTDLDVFDDVQQVCH